MFRPPKPTEDDGSTNNDSTTVPAATNTDVSTGTPSTITNATSASLDEFRKIAVNNPAWLAQLAREQLQIEGTLPATLPDAQDPAATGAAQP